MRKKLRFLPIFFGLLIAFFSIEVQASEPPSDLARIVIRFWNRVEPLFQYAKPFFGRRS
jgi:hypothetical protein